MIRKFSCFITMGFFLFQFLDAQEKREFTSIKISDNDLLLPFYKQTSQSFITSAYNFNFIDRKTFSYSYSLLLIPILVTNEMDKKYSFQWIIGGKYNNWGDPQSEAWKVQMFRELQNKHGANYMYAPR